EAGEGFDKRVQRAFELAYSRPARPDELKIIHGALESKSKDSSAWLIFCQALFGASEFLYSYLLGDRARREPINISHRKILRDAATGIGGTALLWMLQQDRLRAEQPRAYDLRAKKPDFAPREKSVIYLYMGGGPSTIDMFDPKPLLKKYD